MTNNNNEEKALKLSGLKNRLKKAEGHSTAGLNNKLGEGEENDKYKNAFKRKKLTVRLWPTVSNAVSEMHYKYVGVHGLFMSSGKKFTDSDLVNYMIIKNLINEVSTDELAAVSFDNEAKDKGRSLTAPLDLIDYVSDMAEELIMKMSAISEKRVPGSKFIAVQQIILKEYLEYQNDNDAYLGEIAKYDFQALEKALGYA